MFVHTAHGRGQIVEEQSVRGRKSFLVEGSGFKVWIDEKDLRVANDINEDNSTTLPYDPTPQHPAGMFGETSTIQPINEVDADERLSPTDSLSFDSTEDYSYPGPSADNFARSAARDYSYDHYLDYSHRNGMDPGDDMTADRYSREHSVPLEVASDYAMQHGNGSRRHSNSHEMEVLYGDHSAGETVHPPNNYRGKHRPPPAPEMVLPGGEDVWDSSDWLDAHPEQTFDDPREQQRYEEWKGKYLGRPDGELFSRALNTYEPIYSSKNHDEFGGGEPEDRFDEDQDIKHFSSRRYANPLLGLVSAEEAAAAAGQALPKAKGGLEDFADKANQNSGIFQQAVDEILPADLNRHLHDDEWSPGHYPGRPGYASLYQRPAGLSDKYIRVEAHTDHFSDPVQQFRDDPIGFIQKRAYMHDGEVDIRLAEYVDLVESDPGIRTAAWRDVRSKALRLRREGKVHVKDISPIQIYASVDGDSDTYETMIVKGAGAKGQSIEDWHCSCPWGRWAFKRQMSYVGRLCSHGYASFLEMESQHMKNPKKYGPKRKTAGIVDDFKKWAEDENDGMIDQGAMDNFIYLRNSGEEGNHTSVTEDDAEKLYEALDGLQSKGGHRNFDVGYEFDLDKVYKEADILHLRPQSLTPDFYYVEDGQDGESWTDVTKDERKTTGPDNMVKKSLRLTGSEIHYASDEELGQAVKDWASTGSDLEKLRNLSAEEPDYQNKREQNAEIRSVIDELQERGIDASQFVASLRYAEDTTTDEEKKKAPSSDQPSMDGAPSQTGQPGGSSSIEKKETSGGGALSNPTKDPASVGYNGRPGQQMGTPGTGGIGGLDGISTQEIMRGLGGAATGLINAIPSVMQALPGIANGIGQIGGQIGSGIGNLVNGLSHHAAFPDQGERESFQGSGPDPKFWMESSECYVEDNERPRFVDVTNLDDDPIIKYTGDKPKQGPGKTGANDGLAKMYKQREKDYKTKNNQASMPPKFVPGNHRDDGGFWVEDGEQPKDDGGFWVEDGEQPNDHLFDDMGRYRKGERESRYASEGANPDGSTLTSADSLVTGTGISNLEQPFKAGSREAASSPWDGHRVKDFARYVRQRGGRPNHQMLQEYLNKPHRSLDQGGTQHLQDFTSYAEQHEASLRYAEGDYMSGMTGGAADIPGSSELSPDVPGEQFGVLASYEDSSDIVRQFQANIGNTALGNGAGGGGNFSDAAIAEQAKGFLRTAGRVYSLAEQRDLENESHPSGARNLKELDLKGTHYEDAL